MSRRFGMMGVLLASAAIGAATAAERQHGRFMRAPDHSFSGPAWFYGPNDASEVFQSAEDVPAGWQDHPSKMITAEKTGSKPLPPKTDEIPAAQRGAAPIPAKNEAPAADQGAKPVKTETQDVSNTLDAEGWAWDQTLHAATQTLTGAGLWRMKVGVKRPDPKAGYPKPVLDL